MSNQKNLCVGCMNIFDNAMCSLQNRLFSRAEKGYTGKHIGIMCNSKKYPYPPYRRDWNFLGNGGFWKIKKYKEMYEALLEFPEGWG